MKYPTISKQVITDEVMEKALLAFEQSDDKFKEFLLEFAWNVAGDLAARMFTDQTTLTKEWIFPKYSLVNLEELISQTSEE